MIVGAQPKGTRVNIGKPRLLAAGALFLAAATASYVSIGQSAQAVESEPVIWGYS